ncbi:hypothetical protein [Pseudooceanicola sp. HF7]|nr:hypothetical protein [Pseudooceanicola sp. HF7]NIZ10124.1 hypothetical protein [Pseudooceanicola sp. HF7]
MTSYSLNTDITCQVGRRTLAALECRLRTGLGEFIGRNGRYGLPTHSDK